MTEKLKCGRWLLSILLLAACLAGCTAKLENQRFTVMGTDTEMGQVVVPWEIRADNFELYKETASQNFFYSQRPFSEIAETLETVNPTCDFKQYGTDHLLITSQKAGSILLRTVMITNVMPTSDKTEKGAEREEFYTDALDGRGLNDEKLYKRMEFFPLQIYFFDGGDQEKKCFVDFPLHLITGTGEQLAQLSYGSTAENEAYIPLAAREEFRAFYEKLDARITDTQDGFIVENYPVKLKTFSEDKTVELQFVFFERDKQQYVKYIFLNQ